MSPGSRRRPAVTLEVVDHPEFEGAETTWIGHFTDKTADRSIESLQNMGWKGDDLSELADLDAAACVRLLPDTVQIVMSVEQYEGETQLKVLWVNKPGAGAFAFKKPLAGSDLKAFAAQMRGTVRSVRDAGGQRRQAAPAGQSSSSRPAHSGGSNGSGGGRPQHPNEPGFDDDLPF